MIQFQFVENANCSSSFDAIFLKWDDHVMVSLVDKPKQLNSLIRSMMLF